MQPYTYLIGWKTLNLFYYGVRYSKNCHPDDLFVTYYTSSNTVKSLFKKHGKPDVIQIRRLFIDPTSALAWEQKILRRLKIPHNPIFLNKGFGGTSIAGLPGVRKFYKVYNPMLDNQARDNAIEKLSKSRKKLGLGLKSAKYLKPQCGVNNPMKNADVIDRYRKLITGRKMKTNPDGTRSWYYPNKKEP